MKAGGASFVTLTINGDLRGCIGALEPYQPLAEDVREHAVAAALEDYRFPQVQESELEQISIEVSRLTVPVPLEYTDPGRPARQTPFRCGWSHLAGWFPPGHLPAPGVGENSR